MKRHFVWGLIGTVVVAMSNDRNHWNDPIYQEMYPGSKVGRVIVVK